MIMPYHSIAGFLIARVRCVVYAPTITAENKATITPLRTIRHTLSRVYAGTKFRPAVLEDARGGTCRISRSKPLRLVLLPAESGMEAQVAQPRIIAGQILTREGDIVARVQNERGAAIERRDH